MNMLTRICLIVLLVISPVAVAAQDSAPPAAQSPARASSPLLGVIFNANSLLMEIAPYEGGVGAKLRFDGYSLRASLQFELGSANDALDIGLGLAYERPMSSERIAPYWGAAFRSSYSRDRSQADEANYSQTAVLGATAAALLGIEIEIAHFLSVFAEYQLGFEIARTTIRQSIGGSIDETARTNYQLSLGLGNDASIGVVIYLGVSGGTGDDVAVERADERAD
jgi:hypothetical protein